MSKTKAKVASNRKLDRIMVVYGLGENKKPRGAKFSEPEFELARKAAELIKLNVFEGKSAKLRQVLQKLAPGRIYASGESFVPYIRPNQFDKLITVLDVAEPKAPESTPQTTLPSSWAQLVSAILFLAKPIQPKTGGGQLS